MRWYLNNESHRNADAILSRLLSEPELFGVPELFLFEVYAVLARSHPDAQNVYVNLFLPVVEGGLFRHPMTSALVEQAWSFVALGLTGYDACYAALADEMGCTWLTFDAKAHKLLKSRISMDLNRGLPSDWN